MNLLCTGERKNKNDSFHDYEYVMVRSEAALVRRALKRGRSVEAQREIDAVQDAKRRAAFAAAVDGAGDGAGGPTAASRPQRNGKDKKLRGAKAPKLELQTQVALAAKPEALKAKAAMEQVAAAQAELARAQVAAAQAELALAQVALKEAQAKAAAQKEGSEAARAGGPTNDKAAAGGQKARSGGEPAKDPGKKKSALAWAPQADAERIKANMELRKRFVSDRASLTVEEVARAEALIARDEKKKQKKAEQEKAKLRKQSKQKK